MMNQPGYSRPPARPIPPAPAAPASNHTGVGGYPGQDIRPYPPQYDWRYAQQSGYGQPYDPYGGGRLPTDVRPAPRKRPRAGALVVGAVAIATISGGIGGAVGSAIHPDRQSTGSSV